MGRYEVVPRENGLCEVCGDIGETKICNHCGFEVCIGCAQGICQYCKEVMVPMRKLKKRKELDNK